MQLLLHGWPPVYTPALKVNITVQRHAGVANGALLPPKGLPELEEWTAAQMESRVVDGEEGDLSSMGTQTGMWNQYGTGQWGMGHQLMGTQHQLRGPRKVVYVWVTGPVTHVLLVSITGSQSTVFLPPGQW